MPALLVPIALDVLVVRHGGAAQDWARTGVAIPKATGTRKKRLLLRPPPFETLARPRAPGAYLHWAMPDALTRGRQDENDGKLLLPALPDRWLVLRLSGAPGAPQRRVDAWLLPDSAAAQPVVLAQALSGPPLPPGAPAQGKLTAIGPGELGWDAWFDNTVGRFAMHDDLAGVQGSVAYLVCGWHQRAGDDPLPGTTESAGYEALAQLQWELAEPLARGTPFPDRTLYHAAAVSIGWPVANWPGDGGTLGTEVDLRPDPAAMQLALGETMAEATALFAAPPGANADLLHLLEARMAGVLGDVATADGLATLESTLHTTRFGAVPLPASSDTIWQPGEDDAAGRPTGRFETAKRTAARAWQAVEPAFVLLGAGRSAKHGGDGDHTEAGTLRCRVEGETLRAFGVVGGELGQGADMLPSTLLTGLPTEYGVPAAAQDLLVELACLDPGSAPDLAAATPTAPSPVAAMRAAWWATFDPAAPVPPPLAGAQVKGTLPSPIGVTAPNRPWTPLALEWRVHYLASPRGSHDWPMGEIDFEPPTAAAALPDASATPRVLQDRALLAATPAAMLAWAAGHAPGVPLADALGGSFEGLTALLRGETMEATVSPAALNDHEPLAARPRSADFLALRAGFLRIDRLRLVDAFGQCLDLVGGSASTPLVPRPAGSLRVPARPELWALRPRFTAPARVLLRFADAHGDLADSGPSINPVCGYVVAAPLDGTLEFFDDDGIACGRLRGDAQQGTAWEEAPGLPPTLGVRPSQVLRNRLLGRMADAVLDAGVDAVARNATGPTALETLLTVLDITRWSVDLTASAGDEHLSLLLGQPVAIVRASIALEVIDPRNPAENRSAAVPVRLGELAQLQDGLLGYYVADDFRTLHLLDPAVADLAAQARDAALAPMLDATGVFDLYPGLVLPLVLLMTPGSDLHVRTGLLPPKRIGLMREWTAAALSRLSPSLRFGPVLREATATRLPVPADIRGTWLWHRRPAPAEWARDEVVGASAAALPQTPAQASDGWLQVELAKDTLYPEGQISLRIDCVQRAGGRIVAVGGPNLGSDERSRFLLPVAEVVRLIESGRFQFYVQEHGQRVAVRVIAPKNARKYLRTLADRKDPNNLELLPVCKAVV